VPTPSDLREALLERTFTLYWRHLWWWMRLLVPLALTAGVVYGLLAPALAHVLPANVPQALAVAATVIPRVAAVTWLIAGLAGAQALALRDRTLPPLSRVAAVLVPRFAGIYAATTLVAVEVAALGALGAGLAAGLASLPLRMLPSMGAGDLTARSISLLVLLPLLVLGAVPAVWWLVRHVLAIPFQALDGGSPWASLRAARASSRGHVGAILGLLVVTAVASNVLVLVCRAAGSLATLLVAPGLFRPIFGEGPLRSAAGADVQRGATLLATLVMLPLMLLPLAVIAHRLRGTNEPQG